MLSSQDYQPPSWANGLTTPKKRVSLARLPTPIHRLNLKIEDGPEIYVKRDDLTSFDLGGNKIRKLEFLLAEALANGHDCIITMGGIQSNHARATAVAARQLGLDPYLVLRTTTDDVTTDPGLTGNLLMSRMVNAKISLVSMANYIKIGPAALMQRKADELIAAGRRPYIIPMGGSNTVGAWGYLEAVKEIIEESAVSQTHFDHIVFAMGSGGTGSGMVFGSHLAGLLKNDTTHLHGICVCDDPTYFFEHMDTTGTELGVLGKTEDLTSSKQLCTLYQGSGLGYAQSTAEELQFICDVSSQTGVMFDPVYGGKALYHFCTKVLGKTVGEHVCDVETVLDRGEGRDAPVVSNVFRARAASTFTAVPPASPSIFEPHHKVLFIHTGGLFGMYDKSKELLATTDIALGNVSELDLAGLV